MQSSPHSRLEIPESLRGQLLGFRQRLWRIKLLEAFAGAVVGVLVGYLATYTLDRLFDTPRLVRWLVFGGAVLSCMLVPFALDRWVWRRRRLDQLARLLAHKHPSVGDQLLGIIELAESESEQARSPVLVKAAIQQVSAAAEQRDFSDSVPTPRHAQRSWLAGGLAVVAVALLAVTAAAARNAWSRFLAPWNATPRYTFAAIEPLPEKLIIPHGEPVSIPVRLTDTSEWHPDQAEVRLGRQAPVTASLSGNGYKFDLPGQIAPSTLQVKVGDFSGQLPVEPMHRPELASLQAAIQLPEYLGRPATIAREIRGGSISAVTGSTATFTALTTRELANASVDDVARPPQGDQFTTEPVLVDGEQTFKLQWTDDHGLSGQEPFALTVTAIDDEQPSVLCENLPRQRVLLDSEVLAFQVRGRDDFGVKRVGIEWEGLDKSLAETARGETILGVGGTETELLELAATFSAKSLNIEPQPVAMRVFIEDYLPGRERCYSPVCVFDILNAEEHAVWVTAMLSRWQRMSLDVRDKELQLHETNKALRELSTEELDLPDTRRQIEQQAAAERTNGRRLSNLVTSGEDLLQQAMRNPEIGVGYLEDWAEMMQVLKDISGNRMPSVADLLKQGANAPKQAQNSPETPSNKGPQAGRNLAQMAGSDLKKGDQPPKPPSAVPTISDIESTHNQPQPDESQQPKQGKPKTPTLRLPTTMLAGAPKQKPKPNDPAQEQLDEAVREQQDLLAEFEKIADELNELLANMEGSTLVKRLKAASRKQQQVSTKLSSIVGDTFGVSERTKQAQIDTFRELAQVESQSSQEVSHIMDDMSAYYDRSRFVRFKVVLDNMREQDVTAGLRGLGDDLRKENGLSISQSDYWSETLDRWAEDLVEVCKGGQCKGCKSKGSLPPSIVLEVLQILEGEVNLREETRVAEQARPAVVAEKHKDEAQRLSDSQDGLRDRTDKVVVRIQELPDAEVDFGKELALLGAVSEVMSEATDILAASDTGPPAIAAETEAIELLLQSKRFNPKGGGGGGANPGGGGSGTTSDSALALVGSGVNEKEIREDRGIQQSTGTGGAVLPEEFRSGLDEYFNRLDSDIN
ncbi:MAG: hypothetical protein ACK5Q5_11310 [Planctomycetaceae bacterium]